MSTELKVWGEGNSAVDGWLLNNMNVLYATKNGHNGKFYVMYVLPQ